MKKLISLVLSLVLVLGLCACGESSGEEKVPEGLQIGYGRESMMPVGGINLSGSGHRRI